MNKYLPIMRRLGLSSFHPGSQCIGCGIRFPLKRHTCGYCNHTTEGYEMGVGWVGRAGGGFSCPDCYKKEKSVADKVKSEAFKVGAVVRCIGNRGHSLLLTEGREYAVVEFSLNTMFPNSDRDYLTVVGDNGTRVTAHTARFERI